jgi:hypothetical protein
MCRRWGGLPACEGFSFIPGRGEIETQHFFGGMMKKVRWFTLLVLLALFCSVWAPATVAAKAETTLVTIGASSGNPEADAASETIKLIIQNKTGGTVYVRLVGAQSYSFAATNQGKNTFLIKPGKYTYTISCSACGGSITKTKTLKGATTLGPFYCNKN